MLKEITLCTFATALLCSSAGSSAPDYAHLETSPYDAIRKLQPALSKARAAYLAKTFTAIAAEPACGMPWQILVSIAFNESSLGIRKVNKRSKDYGMMQINQKNILQHGLAHDTLMRDEAYSIRFACKLLRDNRDRYGAKRAYWLGIYRSGNAFGNPKIIANAQRYDRIVRATASAIGYPHQTNYAIAR